MKILVDTSVWIDFFNGNDTGDVGKLKELIQSSEPVCIIPWILQELLQGFKYDSDVRKARELMLEFPVLTGDQVELAVGAAELYRNLRKSGITSTSIDCLIAHTAIHFGCILLTSDKIIKKIAEKLALTLVQE